MSPQALLLQCAHADLCGDRTRLQHIRIAIPISCCIKLNWGGCCILIFPWTAEQQTFPTKPFWHIVQFDSGKLLQQKIKVKLEIEDVNFWSLSNPNSQAPGLLRVAQCTIHPMRLGLIT